jgi:two-component system, OmpR family, response regulator
VQLLPSEFALLESLMRHPGQVFTVEALMERVWHFDSESTPEACRTCLKRLRKKIDSPDRDCIIRTIYGVGYRLDP